MAQNGCQRLPADEPALREAGARFFLKVVGNDVYFVNLTQETLPSVDAGGANHATVDDGVMTIGLKPLLYKNVAPGEAVRIGDYDYMLDCDFMSSYVIDIVHADGKAERVSHTAGKGESPQGVIAWEDREPVRRDDGTPMSAKEAADSFFKSGGRPLDPGVYLNRADLLAEYADARLAHCGLSRRLVSRPRTTLIDFIDEEGRLVWRADTPEAATAFLIALRQAPR